MWNHAVVVRTLPAALVLAAVGGPGSLAVGDASRADHPQGVSSSTTVEAPPVRPRGGIRAGTGPVPMPEVAPADPPPVPMPTIEPATPGPVPMPRVQAPDRDPRDGRPLVPDLPDVR
ncbi:hypothetical protein GCM10027062_13700 [Nocardioides hungaricus]